VIDIGLASWRTPAAYLYTLRLDEVSLAWEYLRRNASYQATWLQAAARSDPSAAVRWGLRYLEDPRCDARAAAPVWQPFPPSCVCLTRPPEGDHSPRFQFWRIPGEKSLVHDGMRLQLTTRGQPGVKRAVLAADLGTDEPYAYSVLGDGNIRARCRAVNEFAASYATQPRKSKYPVDRPTRTALSHMRTLQAFDGARVGASQRDIAMTIFGDRSVRDHWTPDGELRAQIRYLLRRGKVLTGGGYRTLLNADSS
jgi:hypothetical protein